VRKTALTEGEADDKTVEISLYINQ